MREESKDTAETMVKIVGKKTVELESGDKEYEETRYPRDAIIKNWE